MADLLSGRMTTSVRFFLEEPSLKPERNTAPAWMKWMLNAAGIYNLAFGAFAIVFPGALFSLIAMEPPKYLELWHLE